MKTPTQRNLDLYAARYRAWLRAHLRNDPWAGGGEAEPKPGDYHLVSPAELHAADLIRQQCARELP